MNRPNRRVTSTGTLTHRGGVPGGVLWRWTSAAPHKHLQMWLGWMIENPEYAGATKLDSDTVF